jgi:hypothetical protein
MKRTMINRMIGAGLLFLLGFARAYAQTDPLPSWNDGPAKNAIVEFVKATTEKVARSLWRLRRALPRSTKTERRGWSTRCTRR